MDFFKLAAENGFLVAAIIGGMVFIYAVWVWATKDINLTDTHNDLVALLECIKKLNTELKNILGKTKDN